MIFDLYLSTRTERNPQVTKHAKVHNCRKQHSFQDLFVIINLWRERQRQPDGLDPVLLRRYCRRCCHAVRSLISRYT